MIVLTQKTQFFLFKLFNKIISLINTIVIKLNIIYNTILQLFALLIQKFINTEVMKHTSTMLSVSNVYLKVQKKDVYWFVTKKNKINVVEFKKHLTGVYETNIYLKLKNYKNIITVLPYLKGEFLNNINQTRMFIRFSRCFSKTKYSFIRQECKNIVYFTLLLNIISIITVLNLYFHWSIILSCFITIQLTFIIYNYIYLLSFVNNIYNSYQLFNTYTGFNNR